MITLGDYTVETTLNTFDLYKLDYVFIDFDAYVEVIKQRGTWLPGKVDPEVGLLPRICSKEDVVRELQRAGRTLAVLWIPKSALIKRG